MDENKKTDDSEFEDPHDADLLDNRANDEDLTTNGQNSKPAFDMTRELFDWAQSLIYSIVFIVVLFTFVVRIIGVDGASMEPTLHHNDKIVVTNLFYTPHQGDVIVLRKESFLQEPIVKRIIATGGQTVNIDFITHQIWVDGVLLDEPYIKAPIAKEGDMTFPATVPEGSVFVLGDNRNNSADSRFTRVGMIDNRYILGHVIFRVFPFNQIGRIQYQ